MAELAIPLIGLGALYVFSNKDSKAKKKGMKKRKFYKMGMINYQILIFQIKIIQFKINVLIKLVKIM